MSVELKKLLSTSPESLAEMQLEELKKFTIDRLRTIAEHIKNDRFKEVSEMLFYSPAGDGMGCDNSCVSFDDVLGGGPNSEPTDISDAIVIMSCLLEVSNKHNHTTP